MIENFDLKNMPEGPGVYLFKDASGRTLYVGKARVLRRRLYSYFRPEASLSAKTRQMTARAVEVETISTASEHEALLLEAALIKKRQPRYNVLLKDDKGYVLFRLSKAVPWPALTLTRRVIRDGSLYFGPFTSTLAARQALRAVQEAFPLRRCSDRAMRNRVRPCLYHYMGQCPAPCALEVSEKEYAAMVRRVELFLSGRSRELIKNLEAEMLLASERLAFEKAAALRDQIRAVRSIMERQSVLMDTNKDWDVFGLCADEHGLALSLLFVRSGRLLGKKGFFFPGLGREDLAEALGDFIMQYYDRYRLIPDRILLPDPARLPDLELGEIFEEMGLGELADTLSAMRGRLVRIGTPRRRIEKGLSDMARTNAEAEAKRGVGRVLRLAAVLGLEQEPARIEAVDVAHVAGEDMRVGLVVFEDGRPLKEAFRQYAFPELEEKGPADDDFAALSAWALRRLKAGPPWPDLLLLDGGKGQLGAVARVLDQYSGPWPFRMAALAKAGHEGKEGRRADRRAGALYDQVFVPGRKNPLPLKAGSQELLFLQNIRDRAHQFAISRHRKAHGKAGLSGSLLSLPGIGPKSARLLWDRYASTEEMAAAAEEELYALLPRLGREGIRKLLESLRKGFKK